MSSTKLNVEHQAHPSPTVNCNAEPLVTQFIESVDAGQLCMLVGACMDGLIATKTPPALPGGLSAALSVVNSRLHKVTGPANDACDVCKVNTQLPLI